jgi:hypothetical protein
MMFWWGLGKYAGPEHKVGVNCRMLPEKMLKGIEKRINPGPPGSKWEDDEECQ